VCEREKILDCVYEDIWICVCMCVCVCVWLYEWESEDSKLLVWRLLN